MYKILVFIGLTFFLHGSEFSAMRDACDRGMSHACYELGSIFTGEDGLKVNAEKAELYLKKACELDHDKACKKLEIFLDSLNLNKE